MNEWPIDVADVTWPADDIGHLWVSTGGFRTLEHPFNKIKNNERKGYKCKEYEHLKVAALVLLLVYSPTQVMAIV